MWRMTVLTYQIESADSTVSRVTRQLATQGAVQILIWARYSTLLPNIQLALGTNHLSIQWVLGLCSHGERFTTLVHLALRLSMYGVIPLLVLYDLMVCTGTLLFSAKNS